MYSIIVLFIYIIIAFLLSEKNHLFLLIIPFAIAQGAGAFIDASIFSLGGLGFSRDLIILFYFFIVLSSFNSKVKIFSNIDRLMKLYILFLVLLIPFSIYTTGSGWRIFTIFRIFAYIPLYYILFVYIFSSVTLNKFNKFIKFMLILNIISSTLYILNSNQIINIFPVSYEQFYYMGESFYRDFATIPILYGFMFILSILGLLTNWKIDINRRLLIINFIVSCLVLLFTFTRGLLISFSIIILAAIIMMIFRGKKLISAFGKIMMASIIIFTTFVLIVNIFPAQLQFFTARNEQISQTGGLENVPNVVSRLNLLYYTSYYIGSNLVNALFGMGYSQEYMLKMQNINGAWGGDIMWPFFVVFTGIAGALFILIIALKFTFYSFKNYINSSDYLFLFCFFLFVFYLMTSVNSAGFNDGTGIAMIPFALYTVHNKKLWKISNPATLN